VLGLYKLPLASGITIAFLTKLQVKPYKGTKDALRA